MLVAPKNAIELPHREWSARKLFRQRRSAMAMDGHTSIECETFYRMLWRVVPGTFSVPFQTLPWRPRVSLALFVHRVRGLSPGLYMLVRHPSHLESLKECLKDEFQWQQMKTCPAGLEVYLLLESNYQLQAKTICCHQDIASQGAFSLGMMAQFESSLIGDGPAFYPRLYWETGLIGQILYLESEAAGIRSTGIGCFFDDAMHEILGLKTNTWQSLYHFSVGGPLDDSRLKTLPPYAHLDYS